MQQNKRFSPDDACVSGEHKEALRGRVPLSLTSLLCWVCLLLASLPLAYMWGVMVGRSHPVAPTPAVAETGNGANAAAQAALDLGKASLESGVSENMPAQKILGPEELAFSRVLRAAPGEKVPDPASSRFVAQAAVDGSDQAPRMPPGMSPAVIEGPPKPPAEKADTFAFVFRVATYNTLASAEKARGRLESKGYRVRLDRNGRHVVVSLMAKGPLTIVQDINRDMVKLGMGTPLEVSRKPVFRPTGQTRP